MRPVWRGMSAVLGLLVGCGPVYEEMPEYGPAPMYGVQDTAWRQYQLQGVVLDAQTRDAIPGIQVAFEGEAARTSESGDWSIEADYPCDPPCTITADDIDGDARGTYAHLEVEHPADDVYVSGILLEMEPEAQ